MMSTENINKADMAAHHRNESIRDIELQEEYIETKLQLLSLQSIRDRGATGERLDSVKEKEKELWHKLEHIESLLQPDH